MNAAPWRRTTVLLLILCGLSSSVRRSEAQPAPAGAALEAPAAPRPLDLTRFLRLWKGLAAHMAPLPVINRAFGGSRTPEQLHVFDRIVLPYRPRVIVYYCGSNDVNADETAEAIAARYQQFSERVRAVLPDTRVFFVSIIAAPQKRDRWDVVDRANALVRAYSATTPGRGYSDVNPALRDDRGQPRMELYLPDQLHYLPAAYERMAAVVRPAVARAWGEVARR